MNIPQATSRTTSSNISLFVLILVHFSFPCWWLGIKYAYILFLLTYHSDVRTCHKITNYCEQLRTKCLVKTAATMATLALDVFLIIKNVTWGGGLNVLKRYFSLINELKIGDFILLLLNINGTCCINKWLHSFVYVLVILWTFIKIGLLVICKKVGTKGR